VGWYAPAGSRYQAMNSLPVSSFLSEMSPDAPGFTANTGRGRPNSYPELMISRSPATTGDGTQIDDIPPNSHSTFPSRSYERTFPLPQVTISVRVPFSQTNGVAQLLFSARSTFQTSFPVS